MSTHILATAERYCDRFIILDQGKVVAFGNLDELREQTGLYDRTLDDIYIHVTKVAMPMNNQSLSLFNRRYKAIRKEKSYYNKFIFNGHFTVFYLYC